MAGKGSARRPGDRRAYEAGYERIFGGPRWGSETKRREVNEELTRIAHGPQRTRQYRSRGLDVSASEWERIRTFDVRHLCSD